MTQPTQAQIEAAVEAVRKAWLQRGVGPKALAEAAINAAAQVKEPLSPKLEAAVIAFWVERCAQVADAIGIDDPDGWCKLVAAAIRKLKDAP